MKGSLLKTIHCSFNELSQLARKSVLAVTNSADAERSFSLWNLIVRGDRRSLGETSIRRFAFLYHNTRIMSGISDEDNLEGAEEFLDLFVADYTN